MTYPPGAMLPNDCGTGVSLALPRDTPVSTTSCAVLLPVLLTATVATLAEFERDLIHERTMAGLAAARARGRAGGRPRVMTKAKLRTAMTMMADRENAARDIAAQLGISLSTLYAYVDAQGKPRPRASEVLGKRVRAFAAPTKLA